MRLRSDVAALGDRNESVAEEWVELGTVLGNAGRFDESEAAFQHGIDGWRALFGENSFHVAHALNELSNMLSDKGDLAGAERALRRSLAIRMETVGPSIAIRSSSSTTCWSRSSSKAASPNRCPSGWR